MARINENTRHSNYVIRIVCEGDKTEPLFFTSLCDHYCKDNDGMDVRTIPQPYIPQDEEADNSPRGSYKGRKRKIKTIEKEQPEELIITGAPPLKWVQYARQILSEGVDESWAVYDKDNHPKHEEALAEANRIVNGKKVNVAFSSRSFEYYLLLHFEYIYYCFKETECGERIRGKKHILECGTGKNPEKDCGGKNCINGYARKQGYWQETKSSESTFPLVKDNLVKGMVNACRLRTESDKNTEEPIYNRNPYTNVDILVGRLIGKETVCYGRTFEYKEHGANWAVQLGEDGLSIINNNDKHEIFGIGKFIIYDWEEKTERKLNNTTLSLSPKDEILLPCKLMPTQIISIQVTPEKEILLLPKFVI